MPAKKTFSIVPGFTWRYRFEWVNKEGLIETPRNLNGFTGSMPIIPVGSIIPWLTLTHVLNENGSGIVFNGTTGLIDLIIAKVDSEAITWKAATFKLKVINSINEDFPLISGRLNAIP